MTAQRFDNTLNTPSQKIKNELRPYALPIGITYFPKPEQICRVLLTPYDQTLHNEGCSQQKLSKLSNKELMANGIKFSDFSNVYSPVECKNHHTL